MTESVEKTRQLIKVCTYYYIDSLSQQEIAERMGISRSQISRMLTQAKASGIVTITIKNPFSEEQKYEKWLTQKFNLLDAVVIDAADEDSFNLIRRMSQSMTEVLNAALKDNSTFGVMAGTSINAISENIGPIEREGLRVVPLVGGVGSHGKWQANLNGRNFGDNFGCQFMSLNTPLMIGSAEMRAALTSEPEIAGGLRCGREASTAIVGIGQVSTAATILSTGVFSQSEIGELIEKGVNPNPMVGAVIVKDGKIIDFSAYSRMIGLPADHLKRIPKVIGVAWGQEKVPAIAATLRGRWVDILVTSLPTARAIQDFCG